MTEFLKKFIPTILLAGAVLSAPLLMNDKKDTLPGPKDEVVDIKVANDDKVNEDKVNEDKPKEDKQIETKDKTKENNLTADKPSEKGSDIELSSDISLEEAIVKRVIDGDTIIADTESKKDMRIRFIGMDTPESVHPDKSKNTEEGIIASNFTESIIPKGTKVYLEKDVSDTDKYDRYLRYIWLTDDMDETLTVEFIKDNMLNAHLIDEGFAELATYEPDTKYLEVFKEIK